MGDEVNTGAFDNVLRTLRVASEWKRDAVIPCEIAGPLLEHLEPPTEAARTITPEEAEAISVLAAYITEELRHGSGDLSWLWRENNFAREYLKRAAVVGMRVLDERRAKKAAL